MRIIAFFALLLLPTFRLSAQFNGKITGKIADATTHQVIEYATLTVTDKQTNKVINGALTDTRGSFEVSGLPVGLYVVTVDFLGYNKNIVDSIIITNARQLASLNTLFLSPAGHTLQGVTVTASAPVIENKIDKIVYNAANDLTSQGGLALDVLKKVPQVNVDIDGNVELQGNSNIRFLINGKPSSVFGNSITDALSSIPASQIKSIEVVTSPGAKYDAQGTGGIINIVLKDNKMQGINGSINLSGGTRLENGSANLNFRHNNIGMNAFFSGNAQLVSRTPTTQNRSSFDSAKGTTNQLMQNGYSDFQRSGYQSGIGLDWNITKQDNITAAISLNHFGNTNQGITNIQQDTASSAMPVNSMRNSYNHFVTNAVDWSLNYKKTFKRKGQELTMLYNASHGIPVTDFHQTSIYTAINDPYAGLASHNPGTNRENDISLDYAHPVTEQFLVETGAKTTQQSITSTANVMALDPGTQQYLTDPAQSYNLKYNMQVYAAYLSASFPFTSLLKIKAGLRYEYTDTKIDYHNTNIPTYGTLVPSIILSHDLKNTQFIKLSYTRRIERAAYRDINPFLNFADPYNVTTGNPLLLPEIGNNFELGYNKSFAKGSNFYIALIERINTQDHKPVTIFYPAYRVGDSIYNNISVSNVQNIGTEYNSGVNVSGSWALIDKLSLRGNIFFMRRHSIGLPPGSNGTDGNRFRMNLNASYQFSPTLIAEAFGNYNSATNNIQGRSPQSITYTLACRKQFWNKNASIGLTATNLFNRYTDQVVTIETADYNSYVLRRLPYRSVGISFTYKFGKLTFKKEQKEDDYLNNPPVMGNQ